MALEGKKSSGKPHKSRTREQSFKRTKSKEAAARAASLAAAGVTAASKGKGKAKAASKPAGERSSFHYVSFNDRLAAVHIDVARSQRTSTISGLDPLPGLGNHTDSLASTTDSAGAGSSSVTLFDGGDAELANLDLSELSSTAFGTALVTWRELNQSLPFYNFIRKILPLSNSLPQLLHHSETIVASLCDLLRFPNQHQQQQQPSTEQHAPGSSEAGPSSGNTTTKSTTAAYLAYTPALDLIPRLAYDLQTEFLPFYPQCLEALLHTTQVTKAHADGVDFLAADIVEAAFKATAGLLRIVSPFILATTPSSGGVSQTLSVEGVAHDRSIDPLRETWITLRPYLGWIEPQARTRASILAEQEWTGMDLDEEDQDANSVEAEEDVPAEGPEGDDSSDNEDEDEAEGEEHPTAPASTSARTRQYRRRRVPSHTRRFASEAFAHLVRKAKGGRLNHVARWMLVDVSAMRSVAAGDSATGSVSISKEDWRGFESAVAGVWAEVIKSVDDHLHSAATSYIDAALLTDISDGSGDTDVYIEARRSVGVLLLTALTHHSSANQITGLLSHVLGWVEKRRASAQAASSLQQQVSLREATDWLATLVGVRKGSRVHESLKGTLFSLLSKLAIFLTTLREPWSPASIDGLLARSIIGLIALSFPTGRIQDLLGPGLKVMDALTPASSSTATGSDGAARTSFVFDALVLALGNGTLGWSGFRQFVMPSVLKYTADVAAACNRASTQTEQQGALRVAFGLLAQLNDVDQLKAAVSVSAPTPAIGKWRIQVGAALQRQLSAWAAAGDLTSLLQQPAGPGSHSDRAQVLACLSLAPLFVRDLGVDLCSNLGAIVKLILAAAPHGVSAVLESYRSRPLNDAFLLASTMSSLAKVADSVHTDFSSNEGAVKNAISRIAADLCYDKSSTVVVDVITRFGFHTGVLQAVCELLRAVNPSNKQPIPAATDILASPVLPNALASIEDEARLAACELLVILTSAEKEQAESTLYEKLLEVERTPLTIATIRERNVRVRASARNIVQAIKLLPSGSEVPAYLRRAQSFTVLYIVGSLKLNFRPVWSESIAALVDLAAVCGDAVWRLAFAELQVVQDPLHLAQKSAEWLQSSQANSFEEEEVEILEHVFKDPVLHSRSRAFDSAVGAASEAAAGHKALYPQTAEQQQQPKGRLDPINYHNQILDLFCELPRLAEKHNAPLVQLFFSILRIDLDEEEREDADEEGPHRSVLERRTQLCAFLKLFGKFGNPKALLRSDDLHAYFLDLCTSGDLKVQQLALSCILTWRDGSQTPYADNLKNLLEPGTFREELMRFDLSPESNIIQKHHRAKFMPLFIRLMYGQIISRRGTAGQGKASRKHAILSALTSCAAEDLDMLVKLMVRPFEDQLPTFAADSAQFQFSIQSTSASRKRQIGFLALLSDVLKHLGQLLLPHWPSLLGVTLNLGHHSTRGHTDGELETSAKGGRAVRRAVYQRLADFSRRSVEFDWVPFLIPMFDSLINAQAQLLRTEVMQRPTALLELLHTWSSRTDTMMFLGSVNEDIPKHLLACVSAPAASGAVISRVLEIFERMVATSVDDNCTPEVRQSTQEQLLAPYIGDVLANMGALLERLQKAKQVTSGEQVTGRDDITKRSVSLLAAVAHHVKRPSDAEMILKLLMPMLQKQRSLDDRIKRDLLSIFANLCLQAPSFQDPDSEFFSSLFEILSSMFSVLRSRPARTALVSAFKKFGVVQAELQQTCAWTEELNSYSTKRLEEPDFDRRLKAFFQISEITTEQATAESWTPLLHNMIFFVQDTEELAIRTNAAAALRQFFGLVAQRPEDEAWSLLLLRVTLPAIRRILRSKSDLVRREAISLLASAIQMLPDVPALSQMSGLLSDGDGEASFFNNIVHLQVHRRVRALQRLGDEVEKGVMSGKLVKDTFVPLVSLFIDPSYTTDQQLINEAIRCIGRLGRALTWYGYQGLVWSLIKTAREHPPHEKRVVRTLMSVLDNFNFDLNASVANNTPEMAEVDGDDEAEEEEDATVEARLAQNAKILEAVTGRLLPALMGFLESRDETDDAIRLPIALGVARLALKLPPKEGKARINKLLNTLVGALKSKSQETRDLTREVLLKIASIIGPEWLMALAIELKKGLTRGPQIAVAAFSFHAVLVHMMESKEAPLTVVDAEMPTVMSMVSEDLFGLTSEDRANTEYKSKHREVRQSKSLDTLERLAKLSAPHRVASILLPLRDVMERTDAQRPLRTVDDALRRIAAGIIANSHVESHSFLILCHSLISGNARFLQAKPKGLNAIEKSKGSKTTTATGIDTTQVLHKRKVIEAQAANSDYYNRNAHRFVALGLDLLLTALKRGKFTFAGVGDEEKQLLPLVKSVGNALYSSQASIVNLALRATTELVKSPLEKVTESLPAFTKQIFAIIKSSGSVQSELVQNAFKTLTTIIRERKDAVFQEKQLAELLRLMEPDIEEPAAQWVIFGLLRAIISRRFVVGEVYDIMTKVADLMVTSQSAQVRENCRALMLQFLLEYPQGKGRLKNQMSFFAKNLSYVFESGRLSVLELLRVVLTKFDESALEPYHELLLIALVMVMANDDSDTCKAKAGELIRIVVQQQVGDARSKTISMVHTWAQQPDRPQLSCVALQIYGILLDGSSSNGAETWPSKAMGIALGIAGDCAEDLGSLLAEGTVDEGDLEHRLPLAAVQALTRLFKADHALLSLDRTSKSWSTVDTLLLFPHESVRLAASRLLGAMFSALESASSSPVAPEWQALETDQLGEMGKKLAKQLSIRPLSDDLSIQTVKNLLYVGRQLAKSYQAAAENVQDEVQDETVGEDSEELDSEDEEEEDAEMEQDGVPEGRAATESSENKNPLGGLFSKLSFQIRHAIFASDQRYDDARWHVQPLAILRWFAGMTSHLSGDVVQKFLPHMLTPIFYVTDDATVTGAQADELKGFATEVQTLIQEKVGANAFSQAYSTIRQRALSKRRERKTAKLMTAISRPEAAAHRKSKVNARKHDSRKRKAQHQADNKIRNKPLKRHRTA